MVQSQKMGLVKKILFIFREAREGEREGEKHQSMVASHAPHTGDLACIPGMCPDWELNQRPFGSQAHTQSTELHQPRQFFFFLRKLPHTWQTCITDLFLKQLLAKETDLSLGLVQATRDSPLPAGEERASPEAFGLFSL